MNDSAGTTWNGDGPLLPPHPEGVWGWRCTPGGLGRALVLCLSLSDFMRKWEVERYWIMNDFYLTVHRWEREKRWISIQGMSCEWRRKGRGKKEVNRRATAPPHHPENAPKYIKSTNVTSHISRALVHGKGACVRPVWHSVNIYYCVCMLYAYLYAVNIPVKLGWHFLSCNCVIPSSWGQNVFMAD